MPALLLCSLAALSTPLAAGAPENLAKVYSGSLDFEEGVGGVDWNLETSDVWRLSGFRYELRGKLGLDVGPCTVVIAKNEDESTGQSAVWAALFPDEPAAFESDAPGNGEHMRSMFMRFHPSQVGKLFPSKTVEGQGDARWLVWAKQQYGHKIHSGWQWDNMPVVPWKHAFVFDMDTEEGPRRYYFVDTKKKSLEYVDAFANRRLPEHEDGEPMGDAGVAVFTEAWEAFNEEYAMFGVKEHVDWKALREVYEPLAAGARSEYELAGVIALLLSHLEDLHISVSQAGQWIPTYNRFRVLNASFKAVQSQVTGMQQKNDLAYGRIQGRGGAEYGYIAVFKLAQRPTLHAFDEALESLGDTTGLILDLRFNGGGDELLAQGMAGRFLEKKAVYSKNQYRKKSRKFALGKVLDRVCEPRGPWCYTAPVLVLQGEKTMSSAESFALMLAQGKNVKTMGDRTAGSSANPRMLELDHQIKIRLPRWLDMTPDGKPFDRVGIEPEIPIEVRKPADYRTADNVFEAAVAWLDKAKNKKPGHDKK